MLQFFHYLPKAKFYFSDNYPQNKFLLPDTEPSWYVCWYYFSNCALTYIIMYLCKIIRKIISVVFLTHIEILAWKNFTSKILYSRAHSLRNLIKLTNYIILLLLWFCRNEGSGSPVTRNCVSPKRLAALYL